MSHVTGHACLFPKTTAHLQRLYSSNRVSQHLCSSQTILRLRAGFLCLDFSQCSFCIDTRFRELKNFSPRTGVASVDPSASLCRTTSSFLSNLQEAYIPRSFPLRKRTSCHWICATYAPATSDPATIFVAALKGFLTRDRLKDSPSPPLSYLDRFVPDYILQTSETYPIPLRSPVQPCSFFQL